jgi:steroid 5-alpha reductase family enzyme
MAMGVVAAAATLLMLATWWLQRATRNAGYVDVAWAAATGLSAVFYGAVGAGAATPRLLVALLGGTWGLRLAAHLLGRVRGEAEDGRYRYLRDHWGDDQRKWLGFFLGQAVLVVLFSVPFLIAAQQPVEGFTAWSVAALLLWLVALVGESIADAQLARWRQDPANRGRTCRRGLWRYSRHPNYFFEWLHWFAYVALAAGSPWWAWSLLGPLLMGASLVWVTGIPFVEAQALRSRGEDYRAYQREVSVFFPWPNRSS